MLGESLHLLPCNSCWTTTTLSALNRNRRRTSLPSRSSRESHRKHKRLAITATASLVTEAGSVQVQQGSPETLTPASDSEQLLPRRLILLRHAHSSWENPSLRGTCLIMPYTFVTISNSPFILILFAVVYLLCILLSNSNRFP